jgi:predicted nucleic acid-binding Zn ribbon protein
MTQGAAKNKVILRGCDWCGKGYLALRSTARTCSDSCRNLMSRAGKRVRLKKTARVCEQVQ